MVAIISWLLPDPDFQRRHGLTSGNMQADAIHGIDRAVDRIEPYPHVLQFRSISVITNDPSD
jgi:hypothetical protein